MRDRLHERVVERLNDGTAEYRAKDGRVVISNLTVIVDHNLMQNGPSGLMRSEAVGISWRKPLLDAVERGGMFVLCCGRRLLVEDIAADDGHMVTAACMEVP
ncbi:hypothetical protein N5J43_16950 [Pseudomonas nicosulfuronedens]|uniref:hypothetical protein n=1 Tax=Pseudomonas nicosulfuronedens TaxID=2571105 RepID=UPI00244B3DEF|nr:hypothetical protein [Pseudomonas nicosulfuronedens]MDH1011991.1 hypothetical protein [Pseudomonas nicosulfuronedens]MDH1980641.1 hypothetical protein [Pseudomonas nicosulfuronedens]MDH2027591.1 hypothetical protein [Pseudomonas nicosulfuronedens]